MVHFRGPFWLKLPPTQDLDCTTRMLEVVAQSKAGLLSLLGQERVIVLSSILLVGLIAAACVGAIVGCCSGSAFSAFIFTVWPRPSCCCCSRTPRGSRRSSLSPQGQAHIDRRKAQAASGQQVSPLREGFAVKQE